MGGQYEATVRMVNAPHFNEREIPAEISWELKDDELIFTLTQRERGQSGTLRISSDGIERLEETRVFDDGNKVDELDPVDQEVVIGTWIDDPGVNDGSGRYHVPLSDALYEAFEEIVDVEQK